MRIRQQQLKQVSFRLYDNPRDRKIYNYLEALGENQSEYLRRLVEQQMDQVTVQVKKDLYTKTAKKEKLKIKDKKRLSGGFKGFRA